MRGSAQHGSFQEALQELTSSLLERHEHEIASLVEGMEAKNAKLKEELHRLRTLDRIDADAESKEEEASKKEALFAPFRKRGLDGFHGIAPAPSEGTKADRIQPNPPTTLPGIVQLDLEEQRPSGQLRHLLSPTMYGSSKSNNKDKDTEEDLLQGSFVERSSSLPFNRALSDSTAARRRGLASVSLGKLNYSGNRGGLFADPDRMKAVLREAFGAPQKSMSDIYLGEDDIFVQIARSTWFENLTMSVIALNALWIAIDIDLNEADLIFNAHPLFQVMENLFCLYFTAELLIRYFAYRTTALAFKDPMWLFDACLVFLMVVETWVLTLILLASAGSGTGAAGQLGNLSIFRIVRLAKMFRMARMARLLRSMPELVILVKGIGVAARSVCFTLFLLMIIIYVFAVGFRQVTAGTAIGDQYFKSVPRAMNSLLLRGTLPDNADMVYNMAEQDWWLWPLIMFFILLASLTVMNMLVGVLVEVVGAVASSERLNMVAGTARSQLLAVMDRLDGDGDMRISQKEIEGLLTDPGAAKVIRTLGVDVVGLVDMANFIFADKPADSTLAFEDFMDIVLNMRGSNPATVKDCVNIQRSLKQDLMEVLTTFGKELSGVHRHVRLLEHSLSGPTSISKFDNMMMHSPRNGRRESVRRDSA